MTSAMGSDAIDDYWIDGGASDGELRCAIESFCELDPAAGVGMEEAYIDASAFGSGGSRKRAREQSCAGPKSKASREKIRRDKLNDRFLELSQILEPDRPPKTDKASILSDAARLLIQLRDEAQELKESNEKLQETIQDLKVEKNELRDEKMKLKADKDRLEQQIKVLSVPPPSFMPHPIAFHPAAFPPCVPGLANKSAPFNAYPGVAMWQLLPTKAVDTSQDTKLWPPNA